MRIDGGILQGEVCSNRVVVRARCASEAWAVKGGEVFLEDER